MAATEADAQHLRAGLELFWRRGNLFWRRRSLFVAQRDDGVYAHGAARGNVAGDQRDAAEQKRDTEERERIVGADAIDQCGDEASETERSSQADADADECYAHALAEDHTKNVGGRSAERDADADFVGALAGEIGDYPVDSYGGKRQRER